MLFIVAAEDRKLMVHMEQITKRARLEKLLQIFCVCHFRTRFNNDVPSSLISVQTNKTEQKNPGALPVLKVNSINLFIH